MELWRRFPNFYSIAVSQDEMVSSVLAISEGEATWNPSFRRDLQDWEIEEVAEFFQLLYAQHVTGVGEDRVL